MAVDLGLGFAFIVGVEEAAVEPGFLLLEAGEKLARVLLLGSDIVVAAGGRGRRGIGRSQPDSVATRPPGAVG